MTTIWNGAEFKVESAGNGLFVSVTEKTSGRTLFLQDENATTFSDERDSLEATHPDWDFDRLYRYLWDFYGYSEAADSP